MGAEIGRQEFSRADRTRYRAKVRQCLEAFAQLLAAARFEADLPMTGLEIELNLVDAEHEPAMRNAEALAAIADPAFQSELGQWNLEINVAPRELAGDGLDTLEADVRASLNHAEERAKQIGTHLVMIGILPTLLQDPHLAAESMSTNPRYAALNEQILSARGEDVHITIEGAERLATTSDTIVPEAACTSTQFHLQVSPEEFAKYWNAAQAIAGIQLALGANSPFALGKQLWSETRIPLFEQATDTRSEELKAQGVRPRVWFGQRWITSIFDLFEENVRYFPALLPLCTDEDPVAVVAGNGTPALDELRLHNGTVYRWNRPIYDVVDDRAHLRVENRVLPAGPTVVDTVANGAFYFGLVHALVEQERPVWTQMSFSAAEENFHLCARDGIDARIYWPGIGTVGVTELVLRRLLPQAYDGLQRLDVDRAAQDRLLGIIEQRCVTGVTGATWQVQAYQELVDTGLDRHAALREMLSRYRQHMHSNEPAHTWD